MGDTGLEPPNVTKRYSNELRDAQDLGGAESGAVGAEKALIDPDLQHLIDAWPTLPSHVRKAIGTLAELSRRS